MNFGKTGWEPFSAANLGHRICNYLHMVFIVVCGAKSLAHDLAINLYRRRMDS